MTTRTLLYATLPLVLLALAGCQGIDPEGTTTHIHLRTVDDDAALTVVNTGDLRPVEPAAHARYDALRLQLTAVTARGPDGWVVLSEDVGWIDLVHEVGYLDQLIAVTALEEGTYDQVRLIADEAAVTWNGQTVPLRLPSGPQTGLKVNGAFCVTSSEISDVDVVFDPVAAVRMDGRGELFLHPVLKVTDAGPCVDRPDDDA